VHKSNIYKIKKMKENFLAVANTFNVSFTDTRVPNLVANCLLNQETKALSLINEYTVCYGTVQGEIGLVDCRKPQTPLWRDAGTHHSRIYDILKMGNRIVSGDQHGLLVGWNSV
jgi:hypothetical protein